MTKMNIRCALIILTGFVLLVTCQNLGEKAIDISKVDPGKRFNFDAGVGGAGQNARNWAGSVNAGVGAKVWESKSGKASIGVGGTYQRDYSRFQGRTYKGRPNYGVGASFQYRFKGK
uniref:BLTX179 n=1 Tax=Hadrurus spadix TaxID=141984 RepID=A0A1W7RAV3_9SCOR